MYKHVGGLLQDFTTLYNITTTLMIVTTVCSAIPSVFDGPKSGVSRIFNA
jgi:hypothetical protein